MRIAFSLYSRQSHKARYISLGYPPLKAGHATKHCASAPRIYYIFATSRLFKLNAECQSPGYRPILKVPH